MVAGAGDHLQQRRKRALGADTDDIDTVAAAAPSARHHALKARPRRGLGVSIKRCQSIVGFGSALTAIACIALLSRSRSQTGHQPHPSGTHHQPRRSNHPQHPQHPQHHHPADPPLDGHQGAQHTPDGPSPALDTLSEATAAEVDEIAQGSGVFCKGHDVDSRRCHIKNLCYLHGELAAVQGPLTVLDGVPSNRFNPAVLTLGTVLNHNALHAAFVDVPGDMLRAAPRVLLVREPTLLLSRFMPSNIMHALHDDVLPTVVTLRELGLEGQAGATLTFLDAHGRDPERDAVYDAVRPSAAPSLHLRDLAEGSVVCFRSAHLGLSKATSWYQYGFHTLQGPVNRTVSAPIVRSAAQTLARRFGVTAASPSLTTTTEGWTVVLLTRSRNRRILNQAELVDRLGAKFNRSVVQLSMETHTFPEICRALWTAGVVVAMHGSLLIAAIFMQPGALLVELFPFGVRPEQYTPYRTAAVLLHLQYVGWTNMNASATVSHPTRVAALGGIAHLAPEDQQRIKSTRWVPPHLCCSDPFWLYRIFSDTVVDVSDVLNRLPQPFTVDADTDSSSLTKQPHVSLVPATSRSPARCTVIEREPPMLRIEFDASWSAAFVPGLFYEVQVDELGQRWRTSDPFLVVNVSAKRAVLTGSTLSVWVQCRTETHLGRFVQSTCHLSP